MLNARRHRLGEQAQAGGDGHLPAFAECSTPEGIGSENSFLSVPAFASLAPCSTPEGIGSENSRPLSAFGLGGVLCSTPEGIGSENSRCRSRCSAPE